MNEHFLFALSSKLQSKKAFELRSIWCNSSGYLKTDRSSKDIATLFHGSCEPQKPLIVLKWKHSHVTYSFVASASRTSILLYLVIVFSLAGLAHADEQHWASTERDGREVGRLPGLWADAVPNIGSALHREEHGAGRGTPANQDKRGHFGKQVRACLNNTNIL